MEFVKQLLNGKKDYFTQSEVRMMHVPRYKELTLKQVLSFCENKPQILKYLPDGLEGDEPPINRDFLFTIVNTIDQGYFPGQLRRIEQARQEAMEKVKEDVIEVRPEVLRIL